MPIYEYQAKNESEGCDHCSKGFEQARRISDPPLEKCPRCGAAIVKLVSAHSVGGSRSGLDQRAKNAGFHKLQKLGKGEYEKKF